MNSTGGPPFEPSRKPGHDTLHQTKTRVFRILLLTVATLLAAAACGQRGPLYLPPPATEDGTAAETVDEPTTGDRAADEETADTPSEENWNEATPRT